MIIDANDLFAIESFSIAAGVRQRYVGGLAGPAAAHARAGTARRSHLTGTNARGAQGVMGARACVVGSRYAGAIAPAHARR